MKYIVYINMRPPVTVETEEEAWELIENNHLYGTHEVIDEEGNTLEEFIPY